MWMEKEEEEGERDKSGGEGSRQVCSLACTDRWILIKHVQGSDMRLIPNAKATRKPVARSLLTSKSPEPNRDLECTDT